MKKQLIAIASICVSICCFSACVEPEDNNKYDALNSMLNAKYSQIEITVTDTFDEETSLESKYTINYYDDYILVKYTVEQFTEISIDSPSTEMKSIIDGEAIIMGELVTVLFGDDAGITADIAKLTMSFDESYFKNINLTDDYVEADVKDESGFLGQNINCTNMSMRATFHDVFYRMEISYTSTIGSVVEYVFEFKI